MLSEFQDYIQTRKQQLWKGEGGGQNKYYWFIFTMRYVFWRKMQFLGKCLNYFNSGFSFVFALINIIQTVYEKQ